MAAKKGYMRKRKPLINKKTTTASPKTMTVHKEAAPKAAHKMVSAADTHRLQGTVEARSILESLGRVIPATVANAEAGVAQKAWDTAMEADVFRKSRYNHLSDLMTKCHRMLALINRYDLHPSPKRLFDQNVIVFALGNLLHDESRRRMANNIPDKAYGFWRCSCKTTCEEGTRSSVSESCPQCGTTLDEYVELRIIYEDIKVGHSIDFLILHDDGQLEVVEIKSCTREAFETYMDSRRASMEHIAQAGAYWKALRAAGYDVLDKVTIQYVCKEYVSPSQSLAIQVPMNDAKVDEQVMPIYDDVELINELKFTAPLPPRQGNCTQCGTGGAKYCHAAALCFLLPDSGEWHGTVKVSGAVQKG